MTKTMNLYIINENNNIASLYGVGTYIQELTNAINSNKINIFILNIFSNKSQTYIEVINDINYFYVPIYNSNYQSIDNQRIIDLYYINVVYILKLYIRNKKQLIFHLNYIKCNKLVELLRKNFKCKIVLTIHSLTWNFNLLYNFIVNKSYTGNKKNIQIYINNDFIKKTFKKEKYSLNNADKIICLSNNTKNILKKEYNVKFKNISLIFNGLNDIKSIIDKSILRKKYNIPNSPILIYAGRLDILKGVLFAIKAFRIVLKTYPNSYLIIVGNGDYDYFIKECEDIWFNIIWTGIITKEKLYDLYTVSDLGIFPSFYEQCSYVAIEMLMHGLPIIGTKTGLNEMINDGESGFLIPFFNFHNTVELDVQTYAEKILFLLKNPDERSRISINARKSYENKYSFNIFRNNMLNFYYSLFK